MRGNRDGSNGKENSSSFTQIHPVDDRKSQIVAVEKVL